MFFFNFVWNALFAKAGDELSAKNFLSKRKTYSAVKSFDPVPSTDNDQTLNMIHGQGNSALWSLFP